MSKCFREGLVYVFTTKKIKKFLREMKMPYPMGRADWIKDVNGHKVEILNSKKGSVYPYDIRPEWCKCIGKESDYEASKKA